MNAARRITGWAAVRVTGAEPERFLDALGRLGVPFWDAAPPVDFRLTLRVPYAAQKRMAPLAASLGLEAEIVAVGGLPVLFGSAKRRVSFAAALLIVLSLLCSSLARIWDIEIEGNETIPDGLILQALADCGVETGARWVGMSQDAVRNGVILRLPEIRWMTVTMQGCRARVIVREKREHLEPVPEAEPAKVVADRPCYVTAVIAKRGTAADVVNRTVLPGETLIEGYATGRFGVQGATRAIGTAEARTWYEMTAAAPVTVEEKRPAGDRKHLLSLVLGKKRINFYKESSICPAGCDKIISSYTLGWPGRFALPLALEITTVTAYEKEPVPAEELREELEAQLMAELLARIGDAGSVTESVFTASETGGVMYVTLRAECTEEIGVTVPLTEAELSAVQAKIPRTEEEGP